MIKDFFNIIDSESKAYWLGFLMADGCVCRTNKNGNYDRVAIPLKSSDVGHLEKFASDIDCSNKIKTKTMTHNTKGFTYTTSQLRINCREMCLDLINLGVVPNKTGKETFPEIRSDLKRHFLRGFFDGDGSIIFKPKKNTARVTIGSSSRLMVDTINEFLKESIDDSMPIYTDSRYNVPFYTMDSTHRSRNTKILELLYKDATIYLERKYERYYNFVCPPTQRCVENKSVNCGNLLRAFSPKLDSKEFSG